MHLQGGVNGLLNKRLGHFVETAGNSESSANLLVRKDQTILNELEKSLCSKASRWVYFADSTRTAPPSAHVTRSPRMAMLLDGCHPMDIARHHKVERIRPIPGDIIFVPGNAWNRPYWSAPARVLEISFGVNETTISLFDHYGKPDFASNVETTSVQKSSSEVTQTIVNALAASGADGEGPPLDRLLAESLLHSCVSLIRNPCGPRHGKAAQTYRSLCVYVQENFQTPLTRESVAQRFGLAPNHVSRLFRQEGSVNFIDYLNAVRVDHAKTMLREYGTPLKAIATACGYQDAAYFCRVFKRSSKLTPTEFRSRRLEL